MKSYSSEAISKEVATEVAVAAAAQQAGLVQQSLNEVDRKQSEQIRQLRVCLAVSFVANAVLAIALRYL
mgnify:CR=1 FL=1